jgi:hypothetical protein
MHNFRCGYGLGNAGDPGRFPLIIDRGFGAGGNPIDIGRWFRYLLMIVAVLGLGTAVRFYFVSWLGERVVADIRCGAATCCAFRPVSSRKTAPRKSPRG